MSIAFHDARTLMAHDSEFQKLAEQHSQYDTQLEELQKQPYLSSEDLILETTLKKIKLRLKDQMEGLIARRLRENSRP